MPYVAIEKVRRKNPGSCLKVNRLYSGDPSSIQVLREICWVLFVKLCWQTNQPSQKITDTDENVTSFEELTNTDRLHYYRHHRLRHGRWWWLLHANYLLASNLSCNITSGLSFTSLAWMGTALWTESWSWEYCFLLETLSSSLFCFSFIYWQPDSYAVPIIARFFIPTLASRLLRSVHFSGHVAGRPRCTLGILMLRPK